VPEGGGKKAPTLCSVFKASLADLMDRMGKCYPHFVRCLKPNGKKKPVIWELDLVTRQLRYAGVLETIKIRKLGYSFRMEFGDFVRRFKNCAYHYGEEVAETKEVCLKICQGFKLDNFQVGDSKVFMKYYHADVLAAEQKKHASALGFLQRIVKGHVARSSFTPLVQAARANKKALDTIFSLIEDNGAAASAKMEKLKAEDAAAGDSRNWMERVKAQAQYAEAEKVQKEEAVKAELEKVSNEPTEFETTPVNGYFVYQRNEHLTLKVGPLSKPWRKKVDEATGRNYFKNTETKTTTWVDPRSHTARPHDPSECEGEDLPFGWDKAQTDTGTVFFINHLTNTHHKEHPKAELNAKLTQLAKLEADVEAGCADKVDLLRELKEKKSLLTKQKAEAADEEAVASFDKRIDDINNTIKKETKGVESIRQKADSVEATIARMRVRKSIEEICV
jgi:myosin heavy subunit